MIEHLTRPAAGEPEGALVLLHGRGADEHDLRPVLDVLDPERRLLGITPRGPLALPPGGAHWYRVERVGFPDPATFGPTLAELAAWFDALPVPPERTVLGGFSQGAVMSYALTLGPGRPRPAGLLALSGFIPTVVDWEPELSHPVPTFIGHGSADPVIGVEYGREARDRLTSAGWAVDYHESPQGHAIDPRTLGDMREWLPV